MATAELLTNPGGVPAPVSMPKAPQSAVEYVRGLPSEQKQAVFLALLREALVLNGDKGLLPIEDEAGASFGYYVPPAAAEKLAEQFGPQLSQEREVEIGERLKRSHQAIPVSEAITELNCQLAALQRQPA